MQTENRFFDDLARVAGGAMGALNGMRAEVEILFQQRLERVIADMNLVTREEFEIVEAMAAKARQETTDLSTRIETLEKAVKTKTPATRQSPSKKTSKKPDA